WDGLELALAGESLWRRCAGVFGRAEDKGFREQVRAFLDALPPGVLDGEGAEFRAQALAELRLARKEGALRVSGLDVRQLLPQTGLLAGYATPQALLAAEKQALAEIADSFPGERYAHLRRLLVLAPPCGVPLLSVLVRYFFRREIEQDRELFQGLAFAILERDDALLEAGLGHLEELLNHHAGQVAKLVGGVL